MHTLNITQCVTAAVKHIGPGVCQRNSLEDAPSFTLSLKLGLYTDQVITVLLVKTLCLVCVLLNIQHAATG